MDSLVFKLQMEIFNMNEHYLKPYTTICKTNKVWFNVSMNITEEQAVELQESLGYHSAGYGFYGFEKYKPVGRILGDNARWWCSASCD